MEQLKREAEKEFDEKFISTKNLQLDIDVVNSITFIKSTHRRNIKNFINSQIEKAYQQGKKEVIEEIIKWAEDNTYKINIDGETKTFGRIRYNQALLELIHHLKNI